VIGSVFGVAMFFVVVACLQKSSEKNKKLQRNKNNLG